MPICQKGSGHKNDFLDNMNYFLCPFLLFIFYSMSMLPYKAKKNFENALINEFEIRVSSTLKPHCGRPGGLYEIMKTFLGSLYQ